MEKNQSLELVLMCKNDGIFINDKGEHCSVSKYYIKNTLNIFVTFSNGNGVATRNAIRSTSEKRILKLLNSDNFKLVN